MNNELWKPVEGFPNYEVSSLGRVRGLVYAGGMRVLMGERMKKGYRRVSLCACGKVSRVLIHRLVAEAFLADSKSPSRWHVAHKDGDPSNNAYHNLKWATPSENNEDKARHGTWQGGEAHAMCKLTVAEVLEIRLRSANSNPPSGVSLAREFGVHSSTIYLILKRKKWKHI